MPVDCSVPKLLNQSAPLIDDVRGVHQRLDVVDQRRAAVEALDGRERRLQARVAALALERVEQRRLLAADVGAGAAVDDDADVDAGAEDVVAEVAGGVGLGDGGVEAVGDLGVLAADVDERTGRPGRHRADRDALDQAVRVLEHQLAVLERAGLGLVGVAAEVLVHVSVWQEARLLAHREAGAAAAAQARVLELGDEVAGLDLLERAPQRPCSRRVARRSRSCNPGSSMCRNRTLVSSPSDTLFSRRQHPAKPTGSGPSHHLMRIGANRRRQGRSAPRCRWRARRGRGSVAGA